METILRHIARAFWFSLAILTMVESWLWDHVKDWLRTLALALGMDEVERRVVAFISGLSPHSSLYVFAAPALGVLPVKLLALSLFAHGRIVAGVVVLVAAKLIGVGVVAFIFEHAKPQLLRISWFNRFYHWVLRVRAWAHEKVAPFTSRVRAVMARVRNALDAAFAALSGEKSGAFSRRLALLREAVKRSRAKLG